MNINFMTGLVFIVTGYTCYKIGKHVGMMEATIETLDPIKKGVKL